MPNPIKVEIWSDIMCPFCYIGKRHFEAALKQFEHPEDVTIEWHSYQLDPTIPAQPANKVSVYQYLADRKGISYESSVQMHERVVEMAREAGLEYHFEKAIVANSFDAHRVIQFAKTKGLGDAAEERFFKAYFIEGQDCADHATLKTLGAELGMTAAEVDEALTNDTYAYSVRQDVQEAENIGVRGVPFFVFNRKMAVSGAQPVEVFLDTLRKV